MRLSRLFVAREIERQTPELKNSLITYVQSLKDPDVPAELKALLAARARRYVGPVDPHLLARRGRVKRLGWAVALSMVLLGLYGLFSPKSTLASMQRLFSPASALLPPTRTRIAQVEPGDVHVIRGEPLTVRAMMAGAPPEQAAVLWSGETFSNRTVVMREEGEGWWRAELPQVIESGSYAVAAGDARSEDMRITALPRPAVQGIKCTLTPPPYTGLQPTTQDDGNLDVPAETQVELTASTNLPPARGYLQMASGSRVWMKPVGGENALVANFQVRQSDAYQVFFETVSYGRTTDPKSTSFRNSRPVSYRIVCRDDQPPHTVIFEPPEEIRVEPDQLVGVVYGAGDDYGLTSLALRYSINGGRGGYIELPLEAGAREVRGSLRWELDKLKLLRGDVVEYYIDATDNWPRGHRVITPRPQRLLVGPEPPEGAAGIPGQTGTEPSRQPASTQQPGAEGEAGGGEDQSRPEKPAPGEGAQEAAEPGQGQEGAQDQPAQNGDQASQGQAGAQDQAAQEGDEAAQGQEGGEDEAAPRQGSEPSPGQEAARRIAESYRKNCPECDEGAPGQGEQGGGAGGEGQAGGESQPGAQETGGGGAPGEGPAQGESKPPGGSQAAGGEAAQDGGAGQGRPGQSAGGQAGGKEGDQTGTGGAEPSSEGEHGAAPGEQQGGQEAAGAKGDHEQRGSTGAPQQGGGQPGPAGAPSPQGADAAGGSTGTAGGGATYDSVRAAGPRDQDGGSPGGAPVDATGETELVDTMREVRTRLKDGSLPEQMLKDLGMNRERLQEAIDSYLLEEAAGREQGGEPAAQEPGRVLGPGAAGEDVRLGATEREDEKDELKSHFDDASMRVSPRYREAVRAYYKKLSEAEGQ